MGTLHAGDAMVVIVTAVHTHARGSQPQNVHLNVWHCRLGLDTFGKRLGLDTFGSCSCHSSTCCDMEADSEDRRHMSSVVGTHPRAFQGIGILKNVLEMYLSDLSAWS